MKSVNDQLLVTKQSDQLHGMNGLVSKIFSWLGLDGAVISIVSIRAYKFLFAPITVYFIASRLSDQQQGFYYVFGSLIAMQAFFELGLSFVIGQFVSHEFAYLRWGSKGVLEGHDIHRGRLTSLLVKSIVLFGIVAFLTIVILLPVGLMFFSQETVDFEWRLPWTLFVIGGALNVVLVPMLAVIEGSGCVTEANLVRLVQNMSNTAVIWLVLLFRGGLFSLPIGSMIATLIGFGWMLWNRPGTLRLFLCGYSACAFDRDQSISWWKEVWPMQWRFAITVISGYFIYQFFTPVLFRYHGAVVAGQMGMTLTMFNFLSMVSLAWINARVPAFGALAAQKEWLKFDSLFERVFKQSLVVAIAGALSGSALIWALQQFSLIGYRFLPAPQVALMLGASVLNYYANALALYLRAHKREPLFWSALISAILTGFCTWFFGIKFSSLGVVVANFAVYLLYSVPVTFIIWRNLRRVLIVKCIDPLSANKIDPTNLPS